jgi:hypothetical protein
VKTETETPLMERKSLRMKKNTILLNCFIQLRYTSST